MITQTNIRYIKDVVGDLRALADPSEYLEGEVDEVMRLLDELETVDFDTYMKMMELSSDKGED